MLIVIQSFKEHGETEEDGMQNAEDRGTAESNITFGNSKELDRTEAISF